VKANLKNEISRCN